MKWIILGLFCPIVVFCQKTAFWETKFYFEDGIGNKDSITIGHDTSANYVFNPDFGEANIIDIPWDNVFEVRATHGEQVANPHAQPSFFSKKVIGYVEGGLHPVYRCLYVREPLKFFVRIKNMPLRITWKKENHHGFCNVKDYMTPHKIPLIFDKWWESVAVLNPDAYVCLADTGQYEVTKFSDVHNHFFDYLLEPNSNGTVDTVYGFLLIFLTKSSRYSPCSGIVGVQDLLDRELDMRVYPNPARHGWSVETAPVPARAELYDCIGHRRRFFDIPSSEPHYLDAGGLPPGIYLLRLFDSQSRMPLGSRKLILLRE
jgi:hypothetical protein